MKWSTSTSATPRSLALHSDSIAIILELQQPYSPSTCVGRDLINLQYNSDSEGSVSSSSVSDGGFNPLQESPSQSRTKAIK